MTLNFNPNDPAKQKDRPVWATYVPSRRGPDFKQHTDRGKALNALSMARGILYHWEDGQWVEVARTDTVNPRSCERCGGSFNIESYGRTRESKYGVWVGQPTLRYVIVCRECEYAILFPLKQSVPFGEADKWYAKYNRSAKRKVDNRSIGV